MKLAVVSINQSRNIIMEVWGSVAILWCQRVILKKKKKKKTSHLGFTGNSKKASNGCSFSVSVQISHKAYFQENHDQNFNLQFCLLKFLPAKNPSTFLVVFYSLNWVKDNFVLCVFFCHFPTTFILKLFYPFFFKRVILFLFF